MVSTHDTMQPALPELHETHFFFAQCRGYQPVRVYDIISDTAYRLL